MPDDHESIPATTSVGEPVGLRTPTKVMPDLADNGPNRIVYAPPRDATCAVEFLDEPGNVVSVVNFTDINRAIACFTPDSLIATEEGGVRAADLRVDDRVATRDNGNQSIRWIGSRSLASADLILNPKFHPVLISKGALGNGQPERDMIVSPSHRLLSVDDRNLLHFDEREVLIAAQHLIGRPGIRQLSVAQTTYVHFMFDDHQIVLSDGAWTESFQPGDYTLRGIGNAQSAEIFSLFPELTSESGLVAYAAARRTLNEQEATLVAT
ncbi:MAG: Hint domain-containing protein [Paracoccaceae bacterium]